MLEASYEQEEAMHIQIVNFNFNFNFNFNLKDMSVEEYKKFCDSVAQTVADLPPLEEALVQQPPGASQQGDQTPHRCRGHLPQPTGRAPPGWGRPG